MTLNTSPRRRVVPAPVRDALHAALLEAAAARQRQLADLGGSPDRPVARSGADPHTVVALAHRASVERILGEIEAALSRMRDGTYGDCLGCGTAIAPQRLADRPWSAHCGGCVTR